MKQKQLACFSRVAREYLVLPTRKITVTRVVAIPLAFSRVSYEGLASNLRVSRVGFASKINPLLASSRILHVRVPSNLPATCTVSSTCLTVDQKCFYHLTILTLLLHLYTFSELYTSFIHLTLPPPPFFALVPNPVWCPLPRLRRTGRKKGWIQSQS